jgi:hypothetical protein
MENELYICPYSSENKVNKNWNKNATPIYWPQSKNDSDKNLIKCALKSTKL